MEEIAVISIVAHGGRAKAKIALADDGQCHAELAGDLIPLT